MLYIADRRKLSLYIVQYAHARSKHRENLKEGGIHNLRSTNKLLLKEKVVNTSRYEKSFVVTSIRLCNGLTEELKSIYNIYAFKIRVKMELLQGKLNFPE